MILHNRNVSGTALASVCLTEPGLVQGLVHHCGKSHSSRLGSPGKLMDDIGMQVANTSAKAQRQWSALEKQIYDLSKRGL